MSIFETATGDTPSIQIESTANPSGNGLPKRAAERLDILLSRRALQESRHFAAFNERQALYDDYAEARGEVAAYKSRCDATGKAPSDGEINRLEARAARFHATLVQFDTAQNKTKPGSAGLRQLTDRVAKFVTRYSANKPAVDFDTKVPRGATLVKIRETVAELQQHIADVQAAPIPCEAAIDRARADIDRKARPIGVRLAKQFLGSATRHGASRYVHAIEVNYPRLDHEDHLPTDAAALVFGLFREQIKADVEAKIRAIYESHPVTYTQAAKKQKLAELNAELVAAERIECEILWQSDSPEFRAETDVRALLALGQ